VRLFYASWPPPAVAAALYRWALEARRATGGKVTREATIHLTLAFLGDVERKPEGRPCGARLTLRIEQAKCWSHNRIVWVGPDETPPALASLAERLKKETRPFQAHVTLIRKAHPAPLPRLEALEWPIDEVLLVRSTLSPKGAGYEVLERFALTRMGGAARSVW
jgi:2'-5' RNA ligase